MNKITNIMKVVAILFTPYRYCPRVAAGLWWGDAAGILLGLV